MTSCLWLAHGGREVTCGVPAVRCVRPGVKCVRTPSPSTRASLPFLLLLPLLGCLVCLIPGTECLGVNTTGGREQGRQLGASTVKLTFLVHRLELANVTKDFDHLTLDGKPPYVRGISNERWEEGYPHFFSDIIRIQLSDTAGRYSDGFVPIPTQCLGTRYVVTAPTYDVTHTHPAACIPVVYVANPNDFAITVVYLNPFKDSLGAVSKKVNRHGLVKIQDDDEPVDYYELSSSSKFGVIVLALNCSPGNEEAGQVLEMMPDTDFFCSDSTKYVVPALPKDVDARVVIYNLSRKKTKIPYVIYGGGTKGKHFLWLDGYTTQFVFTPYHNFTVFSPPDCKQVLVLVTRGPVLHDVSSAMTVMPPEGRWEYVTVLYPLSVNDTGNSQHKAIVVIKSENAMGLQLFDLCTGDFLSDDLKLTRLMDSGYSTATLDVSRERPYLLNHSGMQRFQVIQFGLKDKWFVPYLLSSTKRFCPEYKPFHWLSTGFQPVPILLNLIPGESDNSSQCGSENGTLCTDFSRENALGDLINKIPLTALLSTILGTMVVLFVIFYFFYWRATRLQQRMDREWAFSKQHIEEDAGSEAEAETKAEVEKGTKKEDAEQSQADEQPASISSQESVISYTYSHILREVQNEMV